MDQAAIIDQADRFVQNFCQISSSYQDEAAYEQHVRVPAAREKRGEGRSPQQNRNYSFS